MKKPFRSLLASALIVSSLAACTAIPENREIVANRIAHPAFMVERQIAGELFNLKAYERMHERYAPANIYIEGDGQAWLTRSRPSLNPTPTNPVALHLAAMDKAENVGWLARPCQYDGDKIFGGEGPAWNGDGPCPSRYWTNERFAPEVLEAMDDALDNMKAKYDLTEINLIGYSGGGAIAALLAAERDDVVSFRTVAGNLDHEAFTTLHDVSPMTGSLNPVSESEELRFIPQHHFIGGEDEVIPPAIFNSYAQALSPSRCNAHSLAPDAGHEYGWVEDWPELLDRPLGCANIDEPTPPAEFTEPPQEFIDAGKGKVF